MTFGNLSCTTAAQSNLVLRAGSAASSEVSFTIAPATASLIAAASGGGQVAPPAQGFPNQLKV